MRPLSSAGRCAALCWLLLLTLWAPSARAQASGDEVVRLVYANHNWEDGYDWATVELEYRFLVCAGEIHILYELRPETLQVSTSYVLDGTSRGLDGVSPPTPQTVRFQGVVLQGAREIGSFHDGLAGARAGNGCYGQTQRVARLRDHLPSDATEQEVVQLLNSLSIDVEELGPLKSGAAESRLRDDTPSSGGGHGGGITVSTEPSGGPEADPDPEDEPEDEPEEREERPISDDEARARVMFLLSQAGAHEEEGDRLAQLGPTFYGEALARYEQAQQIVPTDRVQAKIDRIHSELALAAAAGSAVLAVTDGIEAINDQFPLFTEHAFACRGGLTSAAGGCSYNLRHGSLFYVVFGAGYYASGTYDVEIVASGEQVGRTHARVENLYAEMGMGVSLRPIPSVRLNVEGTFGPGTSTSTLPEESSLQPATLNTRRLHLFGSLGATLSWQLPKTPLALGLTYKNLPPLMSLDKDVARYDLEVDEAAPTRALEVHPRDWKRHHLLGASVVLRLTKR